MDNFKLNITKTGRSVFVEATFGNSAELVNYQIKMITNNRIKYLLPSSVQQIDEKISIYYEIREKVSLKNYCSERKLSRDSFLGVLTSLIEADNEMEEFQLINSGILLDPEWVFVDKNGNNPEYIYLPMAKEANDTRVIRNFIINLINEGYVDLRDPSLAAPLFTLLKESYISLRDLRDLVYKFQGKEGVLLNKGDEIFDLNKGLSNETNKEYKTLSEFSVGSKSSISSEMKNIPSSKPVVPTKKPKPKKEKQKKEKQKKEKPIKTPSDKNKKSSSTFLTVFTGLNIIYIAVLFKLSETDIANEIILGAAAALIIADISVMIIKSIKGKGKNSSKKAKKGKESSLSVSKPESPIQEKNTYNEKEISEEAASSPRKYDIDYTDAFKRLSSEETSRSLSNAPPENNKKLNDTLFSYDNNKTHSVRNEFIEENTMLMPEFDIESEETVLMKGIEEPLGYVERLEGGKTVDKYVIKKDNIIIGRLRSQVDMTDLNPRVGKLHAEILFKNDKFYIKDLKSKNGIYIGDSHRRIEEDTEVLLKDGEKFRLADSEFCIHYGE